MIMSEYQTAAINKIKRLIATADFEQFWVRMCEPIAEGKNPSIFVSGHVGKTEEMRWFDNNYSFHVGARGAITMVDGPKYMKEDWQNKRWCGILVKIR